MMAQRPDAGDTDRHLPQRTVSTAERPPARMGFSVAAKNPGPRGHLASFKIQTVLREPLEVLSFPHGSHRTKVTSVRKPTGRVLPTRFGRA